MRRWLPLALVIAIAGLVALFLFRDARPSQPLQAESASPHSSSSAPPAALQAEPEAARSALAPVTSAEASSSTAHLTVRVLGTSSHAPVAMVRIVLAPASVSSSMGERTTPEAHGDLHNNPVTGADGVVTFDLPAGLECVLHARSEDERFRPRGITSTRHNMSVTFDEELPIQVRGQPVRKGEKGFLVPALKPGEVRDLVLEFEDGLDGRVVGKVFCAETGEPVGGARVRILQGSQTRSEDPKPGSDCVTTSNDGAFELAFALRAHPLLCVEAEGYGPRYARLDGLHADATHALVVNVSRAASLQARLLDAEGAPIAGARVELSVRGFQLLSNTADERGFFPDVMSMSFPPDEEWHALTGADGRARIDGLPVQTETLLRVSKAEKELVRLSFGLLFQPGETKEFEWRLGAGATLHGLVLDQDAKPVAGLEILAAKQSADAARRQPHLRDDRIDARTRSDAAGRFTLPALSEGTWVVGLAEDGAADVAPTAEFVEIVSNADREVTLIVARGLYIQGRALTPTGEPAARAEIQGVDAAGGFFAHCRSGSDGEFRLGPLAPGTLTLRALSGCEFASAEPVAASAGETGVVLRLRLGGRIRGRVVDAAGNAGCSAQLSFVPEGPASGSFGGGMSTSTRADGSFDFPGLEPGLWNVTATTSDGRFAQQTHIEVGANTDSGELVLAVTPGGRLRLSYRGAKPVLHVTIECAGAAIGLPDSIRSGDSFELLVPAGSLVVEIRSDANGPARTRNVELKAGETKDVVITDED